MSAELALWADAEHVTGLPLVCSENLHRYLRQEKEFQKGANFDRTLDIGRLDQVLEAFYHQIALAVEQYGPRSELSQTLYYDTRIRKPALTKCKVSLKEGEVDTEAFDIVLNGQQPLIDIHNHYRCSLFSDADWLQMMTAFPVTRVVCPSQMILCPDMQIFALFDPQNTPRRQLLKSRRYELIDELLDEYPFDDDGYFHRLSFQQYINLNDRSLHQRLINWVDNTQRVFNFRKLHAHMYLSRDCRHFTRFSA